MDHINSALSACTALIEDLSARCSKWCYNDINNANGRALDTLTPSSGSI